MNTQTGFEIKFIFFAYVPPYDDQDKSKVLETEVIKNENRITEYLFKIFDSAIDDSKVEILFNSDGNQNNEFRSTLLSIVKYSTVKVKRSKDMQRS